MSGIVGEGGYREEGRGKLAWGGRKRGKMAGREAGGGGGGVGGEGGRRGGREAGGGEGWEGGKRMCTGRQANTLRWLQTSTPVNQVSSANTGLCFS
ncbi:hypothetical protein Pmani_038741 [Petrolisthes manimaculis]|uniref:Uncharacterized protein n=1 Tax=Petrolisthes manimaculis TaxID=1843537 RepID=A0AAE1NFJ5_9EUCA|nr:hypothetical protein Pmani_038741 [Petrolisthes manimaculis]